VYNASFHKFYIDEIYLFITHKVLFRFVSRPVAWFDRNIVDGTMNLIGNLIVFYSGAIKRIQSGHLQLYIWFFASGVLALTLVMVYLIN
jgi:NADH-quinone oxidoreductase subunit L